MANLAVTYGRHIKEPGAPIMDGSKSRTFLIEIAETSDGDAVSSFSAAAGENVVMLVAGADCWVDISTAPVAVTPNDTTASRGFFCPSGVPIYLAVEQGEKLAVLAA